MRSGKVLCAFVLMIAFLTACEERTRYKTLSLFFDGVPDPDKVVSAPQTSEKSKWAPVGKHASHGPYAAKMCNACHEQRTNALIMPIEELCFKCHSLDITKKYLHGPVAAGGCRVCHEPHGSGRPFLLVSEPVKFCFHCHDEQSLSSTDTHKGIESGCTDCHDAHSSDNEFLLK